MDLLSSVGPTESGQRSLRGVSLVELLLTLVLIGLVLGSAVFFIGNLARSLQGDSSTVNGVVLSVVPARDQLVAAAACQAALLEDSAAATGIFVLGGAYEQGPSNATVLPTTTDDFIPTTLPGATPLQLQSPGQLRAGFPASALGTVAADGDFTLFFLDNPSTIRSVVQVRFIAGATHVSWAVNYFRGGVLQDGSDGTARLSYRFAQSSADHARFTDRPGVRHSWLRQSADWNLQEHLGVRVVLPDPMQSPHDDGAGGVVSPRFVHYFPTRKS